jgi:hypothetical protein
MAIVMLNVQDSMANFILCRDTEAGKPIGIYASREVETNYKQGLSKFYIGLADTSGGVWTYTMMLPSEY